jgi:hypothetical protein
MQLKEIFQQNKPFIASLKALFDALHIRINAV